MFSIYLNYYVLDPTWIIVSSIYLNYYVLDPIWIIMSSIYLNYYVLDPTWIIMSSILPELLCPRSTWITMSSILPGLLCPRSYLDYYGLDPTCIIMSPILPGLLCPRSTWISMSSIYLDYYVLDLPALLCPRSYLNYYVLDPTSTVMFWIKNCSWFSWCHVIMIRTTTVIIIITVNMICHQSKYSKQVFFFVNRKFLLIGHSCQKNCKKITHSCIKQTTRNNRPTYQTAIIGYGRIILVVTLYR